MACRAVAYVPEGDGGGSFPFAAYASLPPSVSANQSAM